MTTIVNHDIRSVNGKYILMPPWKELQEGWGNLAIPNVQVAGGDTAQQYPTNTKFVDFDRTHIYGYCSTKYNAAVKSNLILFNINTPIINCTWGGVAGAVGDTVCPFVTSDLTGHTTVVVNHFAGGYMMPRTGNIAYGGYRIVSNTVFAGGADSTSETDFVIEEDGLQAIVPADSAYCHLSRNPYTSLQSNWLGPDTVGGYAGGMGVTLIDPTASTFQWVQTWGPVQVLGGEQAGKSSLLRQQYIHTDGSFVAGAQSNISDTVQLQYAGHLIDLTYISASGVYGALLHLEIER